MTRAADKPGLFAAIRRDAQDGPSIRALAARHRVHRRTIGQALADPVPLPRKTPRRTSALDQLHDPIVAMLTPGPALTIRQIWEQLLDDHDAAVSYASVRDYATRLRSGAGAHESMTAGQLPALPVRPRPRRGETADSYLRRLAAANHLRFSYLRRYLSRPEGSYGPVDPGKLAALTGREPRAILHALPELAPAAPRPAARRYTDEKIQQNRDAKRAKYAAIRRDAGNGMSARTIERKHHAGRRTIVKALASGDPPGRKKIHREPAALHGLHGHINAMIAANPQITIAAVWERLIDEHSTTVAYPTLRTYVSNHRRPGIACSS